MPTSLQFISQSEVKMATKRTHSFDRKRKSTAYVSSSRPPVIFRAFLCWFDLSRFIFFIFVFVHAMHLLTLTLICWSRCTA